MPAVGTVKTGPSSAASPANAEPGTSAGFATGGFVAGGVLVPDVVLDVPAAAELVDCFSVDAGEPAGGGVDPQAPSVSANVAAARTTEPARRTWPDERPERAADEVSGRMRPLRSRPGPRIRLDR